MKSISTRNFIATALMLAVFLVIVSVAIVGIGQQYVANDYTRNMINSAEEVARYASAVTMEQNLESWDLAMALSSVSKASGNHIMICDAYGMIVSCCDELPVCEHLGKQLSGDVMAPAYENGYFEGTTDMGGLFAIPRVTIAAPIGDATSDATLGYVIVSVERASMFAHWRTLIFIVAMITIAAYGGMLILVFNYSKRMSEPLDEVAEAARQFALGDFSARVNHKGEVTDETGALIDSFNKMADSLENSEKRRSEFISNISHELRTPMTTIAGFADGILDGTIPKEEEKKYLVSIRDETRRLARLVRNMLDISKMNSTVSDITKRTVFDLNELALQTLLSFETRANAKKLDVDPQLPEKGIFVRAEKDAITQVIYNLLDNAVKFAKEESCITLRIYKDAEKAYCSVKDEGETIPPEDLPYIFDRFHKSDRSRSLDKDGVGLGLYLVKSIINGHGEDIAVKSENGVTEFVFSLPLAE